VEAKHEGSEPMPTSERSVLSRADELFLARTVESDVPASEVRLSFADLYTALIGIGQQPTAASKRLLLTNRRLRGDYDAICRELTAAGRAVRAPAVAAAASSAVLEERHFPGGSIRIAPVAARPGQVFVVIVSSDGISEPASILAEAADGAYAIAMPITGSAIDGRTQILLDTGLEHQMLVVRLLQDPRASITIVWRGAPT
jgi:hypothetical protein